MTHLPSFVRGVVDAWGKPWYVSFVLVALIFMLVQSVQRNSSPVAIALFGIYVGIAATVLLTVLIDQKKRRRP